MEKFYKLFERKKAVIAMIHVDALPGTPKYGGKVNSIIKKAVQEAKVYKKAGVHSIMIENMHDIPYIKGANGPEITSIMSIIGYEVKNAAGVPCGIQILAGSNREALAAANAAGLDYIRTEGFVFGHMADEGMIESCAGDILRYRKAIGAENVMVFTDIKKKHSAHAITADVDITDTAHAAEFFLSDGVIITGSATGREASRQEIGAVKKCVKIPVLVGSGVNHENLKDYLKISDALIVGSYFKDGGDWKNTVNYERTRKFMERVESFMK